MKKKIKSAVALVLACVMVFCAFPAFAAEAEETVIWYDYGEYEVVYKGELYEGKNTFETFVKPFYCIFETNNEGYYLIQNSVANIEPQIPAEIKDGNFYGVAEREWTGVFDSTEKENGWFCYLEKGENLIGFVHYYDGSEENYGSGFDVTVTYCGEVTDMIFAENSFDVIPNTSDVWGWDPYNDVYNADENIYTYAVDVKDVHVRFSSGKTIEMGERAYKIVTKNCLDVIGNHKAKICFSGYEEDIAINAHPVSDYIKSVDVKNVEKSAVVKEYYNGDIAWDYRSLGYETAVVTFADGTEEELILNEFGNGKITLCNGRTYTVYTTIKTVKEDNRKSVYLVVCLSNNTDLVLNSYECKTVKANNDENYEHLIEVTIGDYVGALVYYLELASDADSATEFVNSLSAFWAVFKACIKNRSDSIIEEALKYFCSLI